MRGRNPRKAILFGFISRSSGLAYSVNLALNKIKGIIQIEIVKFLKILIWLKDVPSQNVERVAIYTRVILLVV
jgi:hypothetical protein